MTERALALDLGSSSVRAIVFESDGASSLKPLQGAIARRPRHLNSAEPGQASFDVDDYLADLVACIDELHSKGFLDGVTEVGMDAQWHSVLSVDRAGRPRGDLVSWADTRAASYLVGSAAASPEHPRTAHPGPRHGPERMEALRQRTGCAFAPMYWTWRAPWLAAQTGSDDIGLLGLAEYVGAELLADPSTSLSMASATGLLETLAARWDEEALSLAGVAPERLPPIAPQDWRGRLAPKWRLRWPALADAAWHPTLGDGAAANLGVGCTKPGVAAMTIGTSAAVRMIRPGPDISVLPAGLWRYCVDARRVVVGAAFSSGGQLYSWALALWEGTSSRATGAKGGAAGAAGGVSQGVRYDLEMPIVAGSEGVLVIPWHAGTRPPAPIVPGGRGSILGLGLGHTGAHITSAAVEAVCFQLAAGLEDLEVGTGKALEIVANGGAIDRAAWWRRRLTSALDRPIHCPTVEETTARGAAAFALGLELAPELGDDVRVLPVPDEVAALAKGRQQWSVWYERLLPLSGVRP